jgi:hypothetical protein
LLVDRDSSRPPFAPLLRRTVESTRRGLSYFWVGTAAVGTFLVLIQAFWLLPKHPNAATRLSNAFWRVVIVYAVIAAGSFFWHLWRNSRRRAFNKDWQASCESVEERFLLRLDYGGRDPQSRLITCTVRDPNGHVTHLDDEIRVQRAKMWYIYYPAVVTEGTGLLPGGRYTVTWYWHKPDGKPVEILSRPWTVSGQPTAIG